MQKLSILLFIFLVFTSCSDSTEEIKIDEVKKVDESYTCDRDYLVTWDINTNLRLKWVTVIDNLKKVVSPNAWIVKTMNCNPWAKVTSDTLIAKIEPDWNDSSVKSLISQRTSLYTQISNTNSIIEQTKNNFDIQIKSLENQITDTQNQIDINNKNLAALKDQKKFWLGDLDQQLESLKVQLKNLNDQYVILENNKKNDLSKTNDSLINLVDQIKLLTSDSLLKIDEIYWISIENEHLNDRYENYLWAKDTSLKTEIENLWLKLNSSNPDIFNNNFKDISDYLDNLSKLLWMVKTSIKWSVVSSTLSQTQIDAWYSMFLTYSNNLLTYKSNYDSLNNSLLTIENNYDNSLLTIKTQIDSVESSISNLSDNKINSYNSSLDVQINNLVVSIDKLKTALDSLLSQIDSLKSQEKIQISWFENQISTLNSNIKNINISLSTQNIYSWINWTVKNKLVSAWNKVWINIPLCEILPEWDNLKLKIYSSKELQKWDKIWFTFNWENYVSEILNSFTYKDNLTQNYIYESGYLKWINIKEWEILDVVIVQTEEENVDNLSNEETNQDINKDSDKKIFVPINFVINRMEWSYIKVKTSSWNIVRNKVSIWEISWNMIEVIDWIKNWDNICR